MFPKVTEPLPLPVPIVTGAASAVVGDRAEGAAEDLERAGSEGGSRARVGAQDDTDVANAVGRVGKLEDFARMIEINIQQAIPGDRSAIIEGRGRRSRGEGHGEVEGGGMPGHADDQGRWNLRCRLTGH